MVLKLNLLWFLVLSVSQILLAGHTMHGLFFFFAYLPCLLLVYCRYIYFTFVFRSDNIYLNHAVCFYSLQLLHMIYSALAVPSYFVIFLPQIVDVLQAELF